MILSSSKVLALSPHTDDVEHGAGGTIARLIACEAEVHEAAFSIARESVPEGFPEDILATEARQAAAILGIPDDRVEVLDYPVRHMPQHRQAILEDLVRLGKAIQPDLVLVCSSKDIHQDHNTIYEETLRAFKATTILGYELPWNTIDFSSQCVVSLEQEHIERKIEALRSYRSQMHKTYADEGIVRGLARARGALIGVSCAEAFEVIRWVIR